MSGIAAGEICDFCGGPPQVVLVCVPSLTPVQFVPGAAEYADDGEWDACSACAALVRAEARDDLEARALAGWDRPGEPPPDFRAFVHEMQTIFWTNLLGERP